VGRTIEVHIEELVLRGFPGVDRYEVAAAVERELERLMLASEGGAWEQAAGSRPSLDGGQVELARTGDASVLGEAIGAALHRSLGDLGGVEVGERLP
jgi:hypothetical protein